MDRWTPTPNDDRDRQHQHVRHLLDLFEREEQLESALAKVREEIDRLLKGEER